MYLEKEGVDNYSAMEYSFCDRCSHGSELLRYRVIVVRTSTLSFSRQRRPETIADRIRMSSKRYPARY